MAVALRPGAPLPGLCRHRVAPAAHRRQAARHRLRSRAKLADGDVLTETPGATTRSRTATPAITVLPHHAGHRRRGLLVATGAGVGLWSDHRRADLTPLRRSGCSRRDDPGKGPQGVPVNRTAVQAGVSRPPWQPTGPCRSTVTGPYRIDLAELEALADHEASLPISCVEGWSVGAHWRGVPLLDLVRRAGGDAGSRVHVSRCRLAVPSAAAPSRGRSSRTPCWPPTSTGRGWTSTTAIRCG